MRILDYVTPARVLVGVDAADAETALRVIASRLAESGVTASADELYDALLTRERAHTTTLDFGVAAPHATLETMDQSVVMIATAAQPIDFGPSGTQPVRLFFVLLSPPSHAGLHIRLLARIARLVRQPDFVEQLAASASADELLERLESAEPQVG